MNMTELIGYYASFQGDRAIVNEDNSVIVFGKKHDFISYHENHPEKVTEIPTIKRYIMQKLFKIFIKAIHLHLMKFPTTDFIPLHN